MPNLQLLKMPYYAPTRNSLKWVNTECIIMLTKAAWLNPAQAYSSTHTKQNCTCTTNQKHKHAQMLNNTPHASFKNHTRKFDIHETKLNNYLPKHNRRRTLNCSECNGQLPKQKRVYLKTLQQLTWQHKVEHLLHNNAWPDVRLLWQLPNTIQDRSSISCKMSRSS